MRQDPESEKQNLIQSSILGVLPGLRHGFGTAVSPYPDEIWPSHRPIWRQVHGVSMAEVKSSGQDCGEVDALVTQEIGIPIGVYTADCVPILMASKSGTRVAAVHAGWRGTRARILRVVWDELMKLGERPESWVAAIGPAIGPCCYEVSASLASDFIQEFGSRAQVGRRHLDLPAVNEQELAQIGLSQIEVLRNCTYCSKQPRFNSYRREGSGTRQFSVIVQTAKGQG